MSDTGTFGGRGSRDASIVNQKGRGEIDGTRRSGPVHPAPAGDPFLIGENMTGGYGRGPDILHNCTIAVEKGEIAVIVGPNGAGKSTAMKALFGMLNLREGSVRLNGQDITQLNPQDRVKAGMGFVPQVNNIFPSMTVEENLEMGAFIRNDDFRDTMAQVYELFPAVADKRRQNAGELSGGQRQQVAVGRALMTRPSLLMLDEPTAGVDPEARRTFWDEIHALAAEGMTVLVSTHYMDEAERCHEIAYIAGGRTLARGTAEEVIKASGLITFAATGDGADRLAAELRGKPGVDMAAAFGATLHVSGRDRAALESAIAPYRGRGLDWHETTPSLEDVFIQLIHDLNAETAKTGTA